MLTSRYHCLFLCSEKHRSLLNFFFPPYGPHTIQMLGWAFFSLGGNNHFIHALHVSSSLRVLICLVLFPCLYSCMSLCLLCPLLHVGLVYFLCLGSLCLALYLCSFCWCSLFSKRLCWRQQVQ